MEDGLKIGFYTLLFLPGFIFVQTRDYHLVRQAKPQLEKTLEIILWSAFIWLIACIVPAYWPYEDSRDRALGGVLVALKANTQGSPPLWLTTLNKSAALFFLSVCGWAFVGANLWGWGRKHRSTELVLRYVTGRDWYPSIAFRFFSENLDNAIVVSTKEGNYIGVLFAAPDTKEDPFIILRRVSFVPKGERKPERLSLVESLLVNYTEIENVQALSNKVIRVLKPGISERLLNGIEQGGRRFVGVIAIIVRTVSTPKEFQWLTRAAVWTNLSLAGRFRRACLGIRILMSIFRT